MKPKILLGFIMNGRAGGVDKYILECSEAVSDHYDVDLLTNNYTEELDADLKKKGMCLQCVVGLKKPFMQYKQIKNLIKKENYQVTYLNTSTALMLPLAIAAWRCNVPVRVVHSHSSGVDIKNKLKRCILIAMHSGFKHILCKASNRYFACSEKAAAWMFSNRIVRNQCVIVPNAIELSKYKYDPERRSALRAACNLKNEVVLGHISNYQQVKNAVFLVDVLAAVNKAGVDSKLLLVGVGPEKKALLEKAKTLGIADKIIDKGYQNNTQDFYQVMDFFLLPSLFEGFPIVSLEAQASQVACIFSDTITREINLASETIFLPIQDGSKVWADHIVKTYSYSREHNVLNEKIKQYDANAFKKKLLESL